MNRRILVTGGAGFIGSQLIKTWLEMDPKLFIVNLDKLTYAGDLGRLESAAESPRHRFVPGDICNPKDIHWAIHAPFFHEVGCVARCEMIVHLAAESHVDRSIDSARPFVETNVVGTLNLLEAAKAAGVKRFVQVSTDEVYGSIETGSFKEGWWLQPSSPYSSSKAAGELLAMSFFRTHGLPVMVTRGANTYGPWQHPEKMIPHFILNLLQDEKVPVYGQGNQVRNWIHVEDHARAIIKVAEDGNPGWVYNISSDNEFSNLSVTERLLWLTSKTNDLIEHVTDRPGHDFRYAINSERLRNLGWHERISWVKGSKDTVLWNIHNIEWLKRMKCAT